MNNYEEILLRRQGLVKVMVAGGMQDFLRLADIAVFGGDDQLCQDLAKLASDNMLVNQPELHPFVPGPLDGELPPGDIFVGQLSTGSRFMLPINSFSEGVGIFGTTGAGKTMATAWLIYQLVKLGIKVWVFDREEEMAFLLRDLVLDGSLLAMSYKDFRRNMLEPVPGEEPKEAIARESHVCREALFLRDGSQIEFSDVATCLFNERGIFDGSRDYPCAADVNDRLQKMRVSVQREAEYLVTLKNRFGELVRTMGDVYNVSQGFPIEDLLNHSIIWRLQGLNHMHHRFFVQDILSWVKAYRERHRPGRLTHVFVVDEVHRLVSGSKERNDMGEPFLMEFARTARKDGLGLVVCDQVLSELPSALVGNLGTRITFRLFNGQDVRAVAASMSLSKEQSEYLPQLGPRRAVVHTKLYPTAFLVEVPELAKGGQNAKAK